MTHEQKIDFLKQYRQALHREETIALEIEELRAEAERITPLLSGMPSGGADSSNKIPLAIERIVDAQQRLHTAAVHAQQQRAKVMAAINTVRDERWREVLVRRYVRGQRWEEIARNMDITYQRAWALQNKALNAMKIT